MEIVLAFLIHAIPVGSVIPAHIESTLICCAAVEDALDSLDGVELAVVDAVAERF